eukprot:CAMPEP_0182450072 /NCGR_PEP_ID=MMETSP1172-20130603/38737_1 /TAXON_ID=708627 /ORGANISM="Timspurckia oligopyrenoides, Strain CCMP3278" /LENGTH=810 /DNA_ID=CAMNT_0024647559 /DNA_START=162 /DNA_END=2594 /DNA_ORIENTATION=+
MDTEKVVPAEEGTENGAAVGDSVDNVGSKEIGNSGPENTGDSKSEGHPDPIVIAAGERCVYGFDWLLDMNSFHSFEAWPKDSINLEEWRKKNEAGSNPAATSNFRRGATAGPASGSGFESSRKSSGPFMGSKGFMGAGGTFDGVKPDYTDFKGARTYMKVPPPSFSAGGMQKKGSRPDYRGMIDARGTMIPPVAPLVASESAWKPLARDAQNLESLDEITRKVREVRSILNKLTVEKFDKLYAQIKDIGINNLDVLKGVVHEVFEKALGEPAFAFMYADMCFKLSKDVTDEFLDPDDPQGVKKIGFRKILLKECQEEFVNETKQKELIASADASNKLEFEEATMKAKRRMLGNIRFIGELFVHALINEKIIREQCVEMLLMRVEADREEDEIEALCKLLSTVGSKMKEKYLKSYFEKLEALSNDQSLPFRSRFMVLDLIELRRDGWKSRREEQKAKKISEIHEDIEKKEAEKAQAAAELSRSSGRYGSRDVRQGARTSMRGPQTMTMHMGDGSGSSGQRKYADDVLRRANESGRTVESAQNIRLGPANKWGSGSSTWSGSSAGRSGATDAIKNVTKRESELKTSNAFSSLAIDDRTEPSAAPEKATETFEGTPEEVAERSKSIMNEYVHEKDLDELRKRVLALGDQNHSKFVETIILEAFEAKPENRGVAATIVILCKEVLESSMLRSILGELLEELDSFKNDFGSSVISTMSKFIGRCAGAGCMDSDDVAFEWMKTVVDTLDKKMMIEFVVSLVASIRDEDKDNGVQRAQTAYKTIGKDLDEIAAESEANKNQLSKLVADLSAAELIQK